MTVEQNRRKYLGFTPRNRKFLGRIHEVQNPLFTVNHELQRKNLGRKIVNPLYAATRNRNHTFHREFGQRNLFHPRNAPENMNVHLRYPGGLKRNNRNRTKKSVVYSNSFRPGNTNQELLPTNTGYTHSAARYNRSYKKKRGVTYSNSFRPGNTNQELLPTNQGETYSAKNYNRSYKPWWKKLF